MSMGVIGKIALTATLAAMFISAALLVSSTSFADQSNVNTNSSRTFNPDTNDNYISKLVAFKHGTTWAEMTFELKNPSGSPLSLDYSKLDFFVYRWVGSSPRIRSVSYEVIDFVRQNFTYNTYEYCSIYNVTVNSTTSQMKNLSDCNPSTITEEKTVSRSRQPSNTLFLPVGHGVNVTARVAWKYILGSTVSIDLVPCIQDSDWVCQTKYAWLNTSFDHRIQVNFSENMGVKRNPEAVYYRLIHDDPNMKNCAGVEVTNATDTGGVIFNATKINDSICDIWFLANMTANFNGTVGYIYWGNNTPVNSNAKHLSSLILFNETCDDGDLYDNSTGYDWIDPPGIGRAICQNKVITISGAATDAILDGGLFWNNVSVDADVNQSINGDGGNFMFILANKTPYNGIGVDIYFLNKLRFLNLTHGAENSYNGTAGGSSGAYNLTEAIMRHWRLTKGDYGDDAVKFYVNGSYVEGWSSDVADFHAGTISLWFYGGDIFDNVTVAPNLYYRNWKATVSTIQENPPLTIQAPVQASPTNNSVLGVLPEFTWSSVSSADNYTIDVSTETDFTPLKYSNNLTSNVTNVTGLLSNETHHYYWRVTARNSSIGTATSLTFNFTYSQWNITFNITGSEENSPSLNNINITSCTYSKFNQGGDTTNLYGPYAFPNGTWNCTFEDLTLGIYFDKSQTFNADSDKIINVVMPEIGGITLQEHTWLEAIYNCVTYKDCALFDSLYDILIDINQTVNDTWQHVKPTDTSVVLTEAIDSANLSASSNITLNYTVYVPIKAGYTFGTFLPIRIGFWFLNQTNGSCYSQGTLPTGAAIEPYCNPLMVQTLGPMGSNTSFQVNLRPNLPNGTYNITRIIEIDPDNVWIGYGQGQIGSISVKESNSNPESNVISFAVQAATTTPEDPKIQQEVSAPITAKAIVIDYEDALKVALIIIVILAVAVVYFYSKRKK